MLVPWRSSPPWGMARSMDQTLEPGHGSRRQGEPPRELEYLTGGCGARGVRGQRVSFPHMERLLLDREEAPNGGSPSHMSGMIREPVGGLADHRQLP